MTHKEQIRKLVKTLRHGNWADALHAATLAADLIEKLTGEPSEAMSEAGVEASRYYVTGYTATNLSYKAMITQAIREVIERKPIEIRESDGE